jgi:hypothetical protein
VSSAASRRRRSSSEGSFWRSIDHNVGSNLASRGFAKRHDGRARGVLKCRRYRLSAHHITPRAEGGADQPSNLVSLCVICHRAETAREHAEHRRQGTSSAPQSMFALVHRWGPTVRVTGRGVTHQGRDGGAAPSG